MSRLLVNLTFSSFLALSINDIAFCTGQSTLRLSDEDRTIDSADDNPYVRYPLVTKDEEIDPTLEKLIKQHGGCLDAVTFLARNVVSPWIISNEKEVTLFVQMVLAPEFGKTFSKYLYNICKLIASRELPPIKDYINCLKLLDIRDNKKKYVVRESLIRLFEFQILTNFDQNDENSLNILAQMLSFARDEKSIYARYKLTLGKIQSDVENCGLISSQKVEENNTIRSKFMKAKNQLQVLMEDFPETRTPESIFLLAKIKGFLKNDYRDIIALHKEAIDLHYQSIERYLSLQPTDIFMENLNTYEQSLGLTYLQWAFAEGLEKEKSKKNVKNAMKIFEGFSQQKHEKGNLVPQMDDFTRASLYEEIGEHEKANEFLQKWQQEKLAEIKKKEDKLKKTREKRRALIKTCILAGEKQAQSQQKIKESLQPQQKPASLPSIKKGDEDVFRDPGFSVSEKKDPSLKKEKVKTRNTPDPSKAKNFPKRESKITEKKVKAPSKTTKIEQLLKKGSKAYAKFCELFSMYEEGKEKARGIRSVDISMHEIKKLLNKIHLAYDTLKEKEPKRKGFNPSKGKGSHAKGEIQNESEKAVFTLSKKQNLLPYQIEHLIKGFVKLGYYPQHLKDALINKWVF